MPGLSSLFFTSGVEIAVLSWSGEGVGGISPEIGGEGGEAEAARTLPILFQASFTVRRAGVAESPAVARYLVSLDEDDVSYAKLAPLFTTATRDDFQSRLHKSACFAVSRHL